MADEEGVSMTTRYMTAMPERKISGGSKKAAAQPSGAKPKKAKTGGGFPTCYGGGGTFGAFQRGATSAYGKGAK